MRPEIDPIDAALAEDLGSGDLTTKYFTDPERRAVGRFVAKEPCVLAGCTTAWDVLRRVDATLDIVRLRKDGADLGPGDVVIEARGAAASLLTAERTALNFLQRLSGVATLTRKFVTAVLGTGAAILDTRKTTPCLRRLEKAAVAVGGGVNHRMGLFDMVMVKDNHLATGDAAELQHRIDALRRDHPDVRVELEADTLEQVETFLSLRGVDVILLDNMTVDEMRRAVALRGSGTVLLEASGGVTLDTVRSIALTGVDMISIGALTHSARAVDFSLELEDDRS
jgi:nicotinate-nucleotide pyrophosphorylase (carboxylating)